MDENVVFSSKGRGRIWGTTAHLSLVVALIQGGIAPLPARGQCYHISEKAAKQNKPLPFQNVPQDDVSIVTDPSYTEHDLETNDSEPEATSQSLQALPSNFLPVSREIPLRPTIAQESHT
ncbi:hypothetical protein B0H14DRAFT_2577795 [Mycena olivaceomarginata]|nr:hypothetical protein B0H14DRAFT_2577795 [Mycena olivaceomarginata]